MSNNWFNAAAMGNGQPSHLSSSSSSLFTQPQQQQQQQQQTSSSLLFGGSSASSPTASQQNFGFNSVNGNAGRGESIPQSDLAESQSLQKRYLESFTPGSKKKGGVVSHISGEAQIEGRSPGG